MVQVQRRTSPTVSRRDDRKVEPKVDDKKKLTAPVRTSTTPSEVTPIIAPVRKPTAESQKSALLAKQNDTQALQLRSQIANKLDKAPVGGGNTVPTSALTTPTLRPYQVPDVADHHPKTDESERTAAVAQKQEAAVKEALTTGKPTSFETSEGKTVQVTAQKTDAGYTYEIDGKKADVTFDPSYDEAAQQRCLAKVMDYHAQSPKLADGVVDRFEFLKADPTTNLAAQYRGGNKSIAFVGEGNLTEENFDHEMGHGVGRKLADGRSMVPPGWEDVVTKDGNEISGYGKESRETMEKEAGWNTWLREKVLGKDAAGYRADDFAETYQAYKEAKESGPEAMEKFRAKFPNRAEYLDKHFEGELRDSPMPQDEQLPKVA